ncbi:MAG: Oligopeptide transport ATP-binding protein OppD [Chlamydiae bacterium]|nr:Oligopeptide transport ATP-binding protein OppD [Chlamydiota bacterium]
MPLLEIQHLQVSFGSIDALRGVNLKIHRGEIVGLVGESGSGKSATAQSILRLIPDKPGIKMSGDIFFEGENLCTKTSREMELIRGRKIGMIFQDSNAALNPTMPIGDQLSEGVIKHLGIKKDFAFQKGVETLFNLGINNPVERMKQYSHELSGGIRQRILLAMAIACDPDLLIADEPTTALDVITQAQILQLLKNLDMSILFITHDLNLISKISDRVYVMYAGRIVEHNSTERLFSKPMHPYTQSLLQSIPSLSLATDSPLKVIQGSPPSPHNIPSGCAFHPRCDSAMKICSMCDPLQDTSLSFPCWKYHPHAQNQIREIDDINTDQPALETVQAR